MQCVMSFVNPPELRRQPAGRYGQHRHECEHRAKSKLNAVWHDTHYSFGARLSAGSAASTSTSWTSMYSVHVLENGNGFSLVPPEWYSVPSAPRTRTRTGSLRRANWSGSRPWSAPYSAQFSAPLPKGYFVPFSRLVESST